MNTMQNNFYIVLMAGGSGTRLWPMSRRNLPKQFHKFSGENSLLQETHQRVKNLVAKENLFVCLTSDISDGAQKQLPEIPQENFIIEPEAKNTAPATGLVAINIFKRDPQAIVATIASDHTVGKVANYQKAILDQLKFVKKNPDYLAVIGIKPDRPDTGFGYIKIGKKLSSNMLSGEKFVEKPNFETAKKYLVSGKYLWNGCYFAWHAGEMLKSFARYEPKIYQGLKNILVAIGKPNEKETIKAEYAKFPKVPIDTAIAEKQKKLAVVPVDWDWSDIGSWASLYDFLSKKEKTHTISRGHHIGIGSKNCFIFAQDKLLATVGLEDIIIVDMPDVTLVCNKNKSQDVKLLLEELKKEGKEKYL